jgi:cytidylate kinase
MKACKVCKEEKDLSLFKKDKRRSDGCSNICKDCANINSLKYYHKSKDYRRVTINENRRNSYIKNKEKENTSCKKWKEENKDTLREYNLKYNKENKLQNDIRNKKWRDKNREIIKTKRREYFSNKLKSDELFKLKTLIHECFNKSCGGQH